MIKQSYAPVLRLEPDKSIYREPVREIKPINAAVATSRPERNLGNVAVDVVDRLTKLPGDIHDFADNLNDKFIELAKEGQKAADTFAKNAPGKVKDNLTDNKIQGLLSKAGAWLGDGNNGMIAAAVVLVLGFLIWRK